MEVLFDDESIKTLGLSLTERPEIPTAEQEVEYIEVEGRNGSLVHKKHYKDVTQPFTFSFLDKNNVRQKVREIRAWLSDKEKLSFSDDPGISRIIKHITLESTINDIISYGRLSMDITFDPFEYIDTNPITMTEAGNLINPGTYFANPKITVYGTGNLSITVNGQRTILNSVDGHITLDCELQEAHKNGSSLNNRMVGKFPRLEVGTNTISWTGTVNRVVIEPRWRYK
ncbi:phage tail family protein [Ralstonia pickettii]|nr:phage tail family protein [Ralstonia pickettii]